VARERQRARERERGVGEVHCFFRVALGLRPGTTEFGGEIYTYI
jgi:hypothetical protein